MLDILADGWEYAEIGNLCLLINGKAFKPSDWTNEGLKIVRIQNLNNPKAKYNHFSGDIEPKFIINNGELLFAWSGTPGTSFGAHIWSGNTAVLNQHIFRVIFNETFLNKSFFRIAINYKLQELINKAHGGVGLRHVTKGKFEKTKISLPPLNEQKRIVAKIEALQTRSSAVKEELDAIKPLLDQFRQSVLAAAFRGDLTKDWRSQNPDVEPAEVLLERIKEESLQAKRKKDNKKPLPDPFEIDKKWQWVELSSVCSSITDGDHQAPPKSSDGIPFLVISNISKGKLSFKDTRYVPEDYYNKLQENKKPRNGDIVYSVVGSYGIPVLIDTDEEFCFQRHIALLKSSDWLNNKYLLYALKSNFVYRQATAVATGTTQLTVTLTGLRKIKIPLTSLEEQKEIVRRIESLFKLADSIEQQYQQAEVDLATLNQSILAKAFRGELVPQDPNDEPATVLLERIREERDRAKATTKKSKTKKKSSKKKDKQLGIPGM